MNPENKGKEMPVPCPRCKEPKLLVERQEDGPAYLRCVACGKAVLIRDLIPAMGRAEDEAWKKP